ncbi:hypothetical protein MTO96_029041, partial [Rhipicephalus appendiculatus]
YGKLWRRESAGSLGKQSFTAHARHVQLRKALEKGVGRQPCEAVPSQHMRGTDSAGEENRPAALRGSPSQRMREEQSQGTPHRKLLSSDMHHSHARQNARPQLLRQSTRTHTEESPFSKTVIRKIEVLGERLSEFEHTVFSNQMRILAELKSLRALVHSNLKAAPNLRLPDSCPALPATTTEAVRNLEDYLENEENSRKLVNILLQVRRNGHSGYTSQAAEKLPKEAALQFSWKGSAGRKLAFSDLRNANDLLLGCLMVHHASASMKDVCNV